MQIQRRLHKHDDYRVSVSERRSEIETAHGEENVGRVTLREQDRLEEARCTAKRHPASPLRFHVLSLRVLHHNRFGEESARTDHRRHGGPAPGEIRRRASSQSRREPDVARAPYRRQLRERSPGC